MIHRESRKIAFCGVMAGVATVVLLLGGIIPAATYCCPILAMIVLLPVFSEFGSGPAWTAYAAVSILALLLVPDKETAAVYVFFGGYPMIRPSLGRIRFRAARIAGKLLYCNTSILLLYTVLIKLFALEAVVRDYRGTSPVFLAVLLLLGNAVFLMLDAALGRMDLLWRTKLRKLFFHRN